MCTEESVPDFGQCRAIALAIVEAAGELHASDGSSPDRIDLVRHIRELYGLLREHIRDSTPCPLPIRSAMDAVHAVLQELEAQATTFH